MTRLAALSLAALLAAGCRNISPLGNRITPGTEPFLIVVGEGRDGQTDLFVASSGGGEVVRLTFTRAVESAPTLHPSGAAVAFFRTGADAGPTAWLVVMNLLNAAEREVALPAGLGTPERVAWSADGRLLYLRGAEGTAVTPAPPEALAIEPLGPGDARRGAADSALSILLGDPPIATVIPCPGAALAGPALCAASAEGAQPLGDFVREPFRWGPDSMGYFDGDRVMVRSLGGGRPRHVAWTSPPDNARQAAYHPGPPEP